MGNPASTPTKTGGGQTGAPGTSLNLSLTQVPRFLRGHTGGRRRGDRRRAFWVGAPGGQVQRNLAVE